MKSEKKTVPEPESSFLEYKETVQSKTYLKTISAFANYHKGQIKFGIADDQTIVGILNPEQAALNLENQINDAIKPQPVYEIAFDSKTKVITVTVEKGHHPPYRYNGKAYRRNGTSTIEVDDYELDNLILSGRNYEFCDLLSKNQNLTFNFFASLWDHLFALPVGKDLLATLGCYNEDGYTITAHLLSDQNDYPGISLVKFGQTINQIEIRKQLKNESVLKINQDTLQLLTSLLTYEEITGVFRELKMHVPERALRETLINAVIRRDWNIPGDIQIEIFSDKITVLSPGGLPKSMTEEEYLYSNRSIPRNTQLTLIFLRLNLIERLGTGLRRVKDAYAAERVKPVFRVFPNSILVELPFIDQSRELDPDSEQILMILKQSGFLKRKEIETAAGFSQSKTIRLLKELLEAKQVEKIGSGPTTKYKAI